MRFGEALEWARKGYRIARMIWLIDEFVVYQKGYPKGIPCNKQTAEAFSMNEGDNFICNPYLQKHNTDNTNSMYAPSTDDVLAYDWLYIDNDHGADYGNASVSKSSYEVDSDKRELTLRYFISQPMNGKTDDEIRSFRDILKKNVEQYIKDTDTAANASGIRIAPWEIDSVLNRDEYHKSTKNVPLYCLGQSLQLLSTADLFVYPFMAPDDLPRGCRIEFDCATKYGIKMISYDIMTGEIIPV